ncbi:hypothetical protein FXO38_03730 [Capsicum annuum]|nr:hypothetical protein FXO37_34602 [Capsicum annuum]KAF3677587.1 hypothetical protein FXO38_03730 [Capsicum annuum]
MKKLGEHRGLYSSGGGGSIGIGGVAVGGLGHAVSVFDIVDGVGIGVGGVSSGCDIGGIGNGIDVICGVGGIGVCFGGVGGGVHNISIGTSKAEESCENNVERDGEDYVEGGEENKSEEEEEDKQEEEEVESEKDDDDQHDDNASLMGHKLRSKFKHNPIKTISIDRLQVKMSIDNPAELTGDFIVKS